MTPVYYSSTVFEAHTIRDLLESHDIEAIVSNVGMVGALGETAIDLSTMPTVSIVDDAQTEEALRVLKDRDAAQDDAEDTES